MNKNFYPSFGDKSEPFDIKFGNVRVNSLVSPDYNLLKNKPSIEEVTLEGNKSFEELGLIETSFDEIDNMFR